MDMNTIGTLVGTLGFPITACCVMFYQNGKLQETLAKLSETLVTIDLRLKDVEDSVKKGE